MSPPSESVRRSVALPMSLVKRAMAVAPSELQGNFNGLVRQLLEAYVEQRRVYEFEQEMQVMAADPGIQREIVSIGSEFAAAEGDGFSETDDPTR